MGFFDWLFEPSTEYASNYIKWDRKGTVYHGSYYVEGNNMYAHGEGHMIFADGGEYEGAFKNGKYHGYGVRTKSDGSTYTGYFLENKRHGEGVWVSSKGYEYKGEWRYGLLPYGKVICPDGERYVGEFDDHLRPHGNGTHHYRSGIIRQRGVWCHGDFVK